MALRGHFRRQLGSSPAAYRAAYRARRPQGEAGTALLDPVVPAQVAAGVRRPGPALEPGKPQSDAYASGRPSLPGQRSAP